MNTLRFVIAFAALSGAGLSAAAQDKIIWKDQRPETIGTVVSINFLHIKYRLVGAGGEQEDDARAVRNIEFDADTMTLPYNEFSQGMRALHRGAHKEAVKQFNVALERLRQSNTPNHPMRDFCRKHLIEAHLSGGDAEAVVKAARDLRKEKPDSFFLRDSFLMQYEAAKMKRDAALQDATIKEIDEVVKADRRFADLQRDADLLRADMLEWNKKHAEALAMYTRLGGDRELWEEVSLGTLRCLSALGRTADLKTKVESLMVELQGKRDAHPRVYLATLVAKGDVSLAEGKVKEALLDYMKGALDPGGAANSYEHETANAKSAIAAARLGKQFGEKDKQNKMTYIERAKDLREELKRTFPQTSWLTDVDAAIKDAERGQ